MTIKVFPIVLFAALPAATVCAQSWSALETLTFTPVGIERLQGSGAAADSPREAEQPGFKLAGASDETSDESSPGAVLSRIRAATANIESEQSISGENSPALVPLLTTLAGIYQEIGDYGDAIVVLEQAQQIVRRWEGLHSLEQAHVIERMIEVRMEISPNEQEVELESTLRELVQRNPGDSRNIGILMGMAGRQMDIVRDLLINGLPPEFVLRIDPGIGPRAPGFYQPRTARTIAAFSLRRARSSYGSAMNEAMSERSVDIPLLLELEDSIIDTFYFELMNSKLRRRGQPFNAAGRLRYGGLNALEAKLANSRLYPGTPEAVAGALLELADWHLMFLSFSRAMQVYDSALAYLRAQDADEIQLAAMFSPETPLPLPAFVPNASVYGDSNNVRGYIDVEVEINRFGGVRNFKVTGRSASASASVERRLRRFVYQSRFRPRYVDGEWQRRDRFSMRYEFSYSSS